MREWLINRLQIPQRAVLNRKITKKVFFAQTDLSTTEKEIFTTDIEGMYILSVMNQHSMNISKYQDDEYNYSEVDWIYVELRFAKNLNRIIEIIHKSIANPLVLIISSSEGQYLISTSHKRLNKNNKTQVVVENPLKTEWFYPQTTDSLHLKFMDSLIISNLSFSNLFSLYNEIHKWVKFEEAIQFVEVFPHTRIKRDQVINKLYKINKLREEIEKLKQDQKKINDFSVRIELHMKIIEINRILENEINILKRL